MFYILKIFSVYRSYNLSTTRAHDAGEEKLAFWLGSQMCEPRCKSDMKTVESCNGPLMGTRLAHSHLWATDWVWVGWVSGFECIENQNTLVDSYESIWWKASSLCCCGDSEPCHQVHHHDVPIANISIIESPSPEMPQQLLIPVFSEGYINISRDWRTTHCTC